MPHKNSVTLRSKNICIRLLSINNSANASEYNICIIFDDLQLFFSKIYFEIFLFSLVIFVLKAINSKGFTGLSGF